LHTRSSVSAITPTIIPQELWASSIQSVPSHPISLRSLLILSTHLRLGLLSCLFPSCFPTNNLYAFLVSPIWLLLLLLLLIYVTVFFLILVCEAIGTAATPGLLCQHRVIMKMIVEKQMECRLAGETQVLGENLPQRHFCPSRNPTWPDLDLNPGLRGGKPPTIFFIVINLWGYWLCGHSWPIVPDSGDSEDDCGEADGM
jgi:hypothetical protein